MFFSSPSADLRIIIFLLCAVLVLSVGVYFLTKKILASMFLFSLLGNFIIFGNVDYNFANMFDIFWLFNFSRNFWPYINVLLLIIIITNHFRQKNAKIKTN